MATLNIEINFETKTDNPAEEIDGIKVNLPTEKLTSFIEGQLGDLYLNLLIPHDGVMMELHAKKEKMKKKEALFYLTPISNGLSIRVKGTFKVDAYSHVAERMKSSQEPIYVTGLFAGDWPPIGANLIDYDVIKQTSKIIAKLV